jgi:hypothetical protein
MARKPEGKRAKTPASTTRKGIRGGSACPRAKAKKPPVSVDLVQARADFVRYYIEQDFKDATGAYRRAYSEASEATAAVNSSRLLKNTKIQELISTELEALLAEKRRPLEKRILDTWLVRAFYDPTEILDLSGRLKITEAQLRKRGLHVCIDSINRKLNAKGDAYLEYKLADRDKALDMLRQYIAMIKPQDQRLVVENISIGLPPPPPAAKTPAAEAGALEPPKDAGSEDGGGI